MHVANIEKCNWLFVNGYWLFGGWRMRIISVVPAALWNHQCEKKDFW
jgi:hypothetical protein